MPAGTRSAAWIEQGLQSHQTRGLAVAAHAHDRPTAGRPLVAGGGGRHPVAAERRGTRGGTTIPETTLLDVTAILSTLRQTAARHPSAPGRSIFRRGWVLILVALLPPAATAAGRVSPRALARGPHA